MMHTWFECKIRYEKVMENGMQKRLQNLIWSMRLALQKLKHELSKK